MFELDITRIPLVMQKVMVVAPRLHFNELAKDGRYSTGATPRERLRAGRAQDENPKLIGHASSARVNGAKIKKRRL